MFYPQLPGREPDQEQMEASRALEQLLDAEDVKDMDGEFLGMIQEEIGRRRDALDRVEALICGDSDSEDPKPDKPDGTGGTKRIDDFIARMREAGRKEERMIDETPEQRRRRIASGKKPKVVGSNVLVAFT